MDKGRDLPERRRYEVLIRIEPVADHAQDGCLYAAEGERALVAGGEAECAGSVEADKPVGLAAGVCRGGKGVVFMTGLQLPETLADGLVRQGRDPEPVEGSSALQVFVDIPEDELSFTAGIGCNDNHIRPVEEVFEHLHLLGDECVHLLCLGFAAIDDMGFPRLGDHWEFCSRKSHLFRGIKSHEVAEGPGYAITVPFEVAVRFLAVRGVGSDNLGDASGDGGFFSNDESICHKLCFLLFDGAGKGRSEQSCLFLGFRVLCL